jgi:uncharacterized protein (TIGR02118 family)
VREVPELRRYVQSHTIDQFYRGGEPPYDGIAELWYDDTAAMRRIADTPASRAAADDDAKFLDMSKFGFVLADEQVVVDHVLTDAMPKLMAFLNRRSGMTVDEFQSYLREKHAPPAAKMPSQRRYVQNHVRRSAYDGGRIPRYDGVAEAWFDNLDWLMNPPDTTNFNGIRSDEANFLSSRIAFIITREYRIVYPVTEVTTWANIRFDLASNPVNKMSPGSGCATFGRSSTPAVTTAATLDQVSGGRLNLGMGAGWYELEHQSFGIDFKTLRGRLQALDESCQIVTGMFTQDKTSFDGKHYKVADAVCNPKPLQKPRIPIMIGGRGEKSLLKIVAKHADMWNTTHSNPAEMKRLIDVIERHGGTVGRNADEIEKTIMMPLCYKASKEHEHMISQVVAGMARISPEQARDRTMIGGKDECLDKVAAYKKIGVTHFIFNLRWPIPIEDEFQAFAEEVIPVLDRN